MRTAKVIRYLLIAEVAPTAPPCFRSRDEWVQFVFDADKNNSRSGRESRKPMRPNDTFNHEFNFCTSCRFTSEERARMAPSKQCNPDHLRELAK